jgi:hypothetical protein
MMSQGSLNWPPLWTGPHGPDDPLPQGEVGTLARVEMGTLSLTAAHCFLVIKYNGRDYFGCLFFDDEQFYKEICKTLQTQIGQPISAIGSLDIT